MLLNWIVNHWEFLIILGVYLIFIVVCTYGTENNTYINDDYSEKNPYKRRK